MNFITSADDVQTYIKICDKEQVSPDDYIITALTSTWNGELNLSKQTLSCFTWEAVGKIISTTNVISKLNFSDCLIPSKSLASLLKYITQSTNIHTVLLRGNDIKTTNVLHLGSMLQNNATLKRLSLEWNDIGTFPDTFLVFCRGLAANVALESLNLSNNQISHECAPYLSTALQKNTTLNSLDLCWNSLGWIGGRSLHEALQKNKTLTNIKLTGNYIPKELQCAIEAYAVQNNNRLDMLKDFEAKTEFFKKHLTNAEENKNKKLESMSRENEEKMQEFVKVSENRLSQLDNALSERASTVSTLQSQLDFINACLKKSEEKVTILERELFEKCREIQELKDDNSRESENLKKILTEKNTLLSHDFEETKSNLKFEQEQSTKMESKLNIQAEEVIQLKNEIFNLNEKLKDTLKLHEDTLLSECSGNQERLINVQRECENRVNRVQGELDSVSTILNEKVHSLERSNEVLEKIRTELHSKLEREKAEREEEVAVVSQQTKAKEASRMAQYEEKLSSLREEKCLLEKQLSLNHSTMMQLQQQNAQLIAEVSEPKRKLSQLHEDLSSERMTSQKVRQELSEELNKAQSSKQKTEKLQHEVEMLQAHVAQLTSAQVHRDREMLKEVEKLQDLLAQRDREIDNIRADEVERAGALYSAFNKYIGGLSPSATLPKARSGT